MIPPKLSICIASIHERCLLLNRLLERLHQTRCEEVEVLVSIDSGHKSTGLKRNQLVARATGDYIVHVDDDDLVSERYIAAILEAIDAHAPDAVAIRGERTDLDGVEKSVLFDYKLDGGGASGVVEHEILWHNPGHLCPMRSAIARAVSFPNKEPEDLVWLRWVQPLIRTVAHAGHDNEILYFYLWSSKKRARWQ